MRIIHYPSKLALIFSALFLTHCAAPIPAGAVRLGGALDKPGDWNAARIRTELAADLKTIEYTSRGEKHHSTCIPLLALLKAAGTHTDLKMNPNTDPKLKEAYETLVKDVPEEQREEVMAQMARQKQRTVSRSQAQHQSRSEAVGV